MYRTHFQLRESPFATVPDPRFLFSTEDVQESIAATCYGIRQHRGITMICAPSGCGKSLLARVVAQTLADEAHTAFLSHPVEQPRDFWTGAARAFDVPLSASHTTGEIYERLQQALVGSVLDQELQSLIVDDAHRLPVEVLEHVVLLAGMESEGRALCHVVLLGQKSVLPTLNDPRLEDLRQRLHCVCNLRPFGQEQSRQYLQHRLNIAGATETRIFTDEAVDLIHRYARGVPRVINQVADKALLAAYGADQAVVDYATIADVVGQMFTQEAAATCLQPSKQTGVIANADPKTSVIPSTPKSQDPRRHARGFESPGVPAYPSAKRHSPGSTRAVQPSGAKRFGRAAKTIDRHGRNEKSRCRQRTPGELRDRLDRLINRAKTDGPSWPGETSSVEPNSTVMEACGDTRTGELRRRVERLTQLFLAGSGAEVSEPALS